MKVERAKLFQNGGSQAVRLPRSCRFPEGQREVLVRKEGERIVLEPIDAWSDKFVGCLGAWNGAMERPTQASLGSLRVFRKR